jgi:hypothetical protein
MIQILTPALTLRSAAWALLLLIALTGCSANANSNANSANPANVAEDGTTAAPLRDFPYPKIPELLATPAERRDYLLRHYWDNFPMGDTMTVLHNPDVTEQGLSNYLALINEEETQAETREAAFDALCALLHGHAEAQQYFVDQLNDYLFVANSPVYQEQTFGTFLDRMMRDTLIDEVHRLRFAPILELIGRNNPGMEASDFCYETPDGRQHTLHSTSATHDRLLLIFYDPDCEHCQEVLQQMFADPKLAAAVAQRQLTLLAVYTEGNAARWRETLDEFPAGWTIGNDVTETVRRTMLYDLKAMPTVYLMDAQHVVLKKDAPYEACLE